MTYIKNLAAMHLWAEQYQMIVKKAASDIHRQKLINGSKLILAKYILIKGGNMWKNL